MSLKNLPEIRADHRLGAAQFDARPDALERWQPATAGDEPMVATYAIKAAILLMCGHLYANREDVVAGMQSFAMPHGSRDLLRPHRRSQGI